MTAVNQPPPTAPEAAPPSRSRARTVLQVVGFLGSLGLMAWCVWLAVSNPKFAQQLGRLGDAPWTVLAGLVGLSAATTCLSGLVFWTVLRPVRALPALDCIAVNAMATLVGYAPFKLGFFARVLVNHRRDGLPLPLIAAWIAATGVVLLASLVPPVGATLWLGDPAATGPTATLGPAWWATAVGGLAVLGVLLVAVSRWVSGEAGWALAQRLAALTRLGWVRRLAASDFARTAHGGTAMLASPRAVATALVLRSIDIAAQAVRFWLAGVAVGVTVTPDQAVLAGAAYFVLQALSPAGTLGVRESGTAGMLAFMHSQEMLVVVLVVSMAQAVGDIVLGIASLAWLRVDRLLAGPRTLN